jgi:MOSC domain-containing protein YiiM
MKLLAICTGKAMPIAGKSGLTGHFKAPQTGAVRIDIYGLEGDTIVDTDHHGGREQAVYIFGEADRLWWEGELGHPAPAGYFGENLLIDGIASADLALGDILDVGAVRLQITAPRIPCVTFNERTGDPKGVHKFLASSRPGAYARVLRQGDVAAWDPVEHTPWKGARITIPEHLDRYTNATMDDAYLRSTLTIPAHDGLHQIARMRLGLSA